MAVFLLRNAGLALMFIMLHTGTNKKTKSNWGRFHEDKRGYW